MKFRTVAFCVAGLVVLATPCWARLWKPTTLQMIQDYASIDHNKSPDSHVVIHWLAAPTMTTPTMQALMDKYVVISLIDYKFFEGAQVWNDVEGVQVTDAKGQALTEVTGDAIPPTLVGMIASADAASHAATQGKAKIHWMVLEAGDIHACGAGKLLVAYAGETYNYDLPMPGCPKP